MTARPHRRARAAPPPEARHAFTARVLAALDELASRLDPAALAAVAQPASGYAVLLNALEHPSAVEALRRDDPLGPARLRGLRAREELLNAEGGALSSAEMAERLRISRQAVDKRRRAGQLLAVSLGARRWLYPAWQAADGEALRGLAEVLDALRGHDPWMQLGFVLGGSARLGGRSPLAALREGRVDDAVAAARAFGEHGAA